MKPAEVAEAPAEVVAADPTPEPVADARIRRRSRRTPDPRRSRRAPHDRAPQLRHHAPPPVP